MILKVKFSLAFCILLVILDVFRLSEAKRNVNPVFGISTLKNENSQKDAEIDLNKNFSTVVERFGNRLLTELEKKNPRKNIIFSPFSIETCLAMVRMGAKGETATELDNVLFLSSQNPNVVASNFHSVLEEYQNNSTTKIANKMYVMQDFEIKEEFEQMATQKFFSSTDSLDFAENDKAALTINSWVESETNYTIKDLVNPSSLNGNTRLVLVNTVYFKGDWTLQFDKFFTYETYFNRSDGTSVNVQMMKKIEEYNYVVLPELNATAVELTYRDSENTLIIVLPHYVTGIAELENKIQTSSLSDIVQRMKLKYMTLQIPKFKAEFHANLNSVLSNMGMKRIFDETAQLGNLFKFEEGVGISSLTHKAFFEVNEWGTEAGAATEGDFPDRMSINTEFIADHEFLYYLRSKTGIVLFEGKQTFTD